MSELGLHDYNRRMGGASTAILPEWDWGETVLSILLKNLCMIQLLEFDKEMCMSARRLVFT